MAITKKAILFESKKKLDEGALKLGPEDVKKLDEIVKLAKEIGLVTVADVIKFLENESEPGDTVYSALKCYRDMLGKDFEIKVEECFKKLDESIWNTDEDTPDVKHLSKEQLDRVVETYEWEEGETVTDAYITSDDALHIIYDDKDGVQGEYIPETRTDEDKSKLDYILNGTVTEGCEKQSLTEDKFYLSKKDAEDDFTRLNHFLSVNGYSEIPYEVAGEVAVAAEGDVDAELISKGQLGYLGVDPDGYITVTAESSENLDKAREIAADFDCPIESEATVKTKSGKVTYVITINPFCGYEYGTPECEAAIAKYTPDNQDVYAKRAEERKAKRKAAAGDDDDDGDDELDVDDVDFDGLEGLAEELEEAKKAVTEAVEEDDEDLVECEWCHEKYEEGELIKTPIGRICHRCKMAIESKEGPLDEGGCKKAKCEECGSECDEETLVEELSRGHICKECLRKHRLAGEAVAYIRKTK